ncbi:(R)-limonene synthase, putative [Ricinus communis]|uniref:(R)-limonene synthase, putative n=1 Tax=Ricinus communis TaxID=3988 RepID=B9SXQ2_RICCO|nr:(R)-limonene synthase, putative [Ricinus communis]
MPRIEALNFVNVYQKDDTKNLVLLELARLDYNLVQSVYQIEVKELARWWSHFGLRKKLQFSRDRLRENYLWAMGMIFEPHFSKCRTGLIKFVCILTAIDDMYDIYGYLDELELFTDAVNRWDIAALEELPEYMKLCYFAMYNFANELAYDVMKDEGFNILLYLRGETNLCKSYLAEARWFCSGHTPTLEEYLGNAWISGGGPVVVLHSFVMSEHHVSHDSLDSLKHAHELIYCSSLITRLSDDLGTSAAESRRGDVTKSIQCYMTEKGATEVEAGEHIKGLKSHSWKKLNEERSKCCLPKSLVNMTMNMARTAQFLFQYGDGIGTSIGVTRDPLTLLVAEPISIQSNNHVI